MYQYQCKNVLQMHASVCHATVKIHAYQSRWAGRSQNVCDPKSVLAAAMSSSIPLQRSTRASFSAILYNVPRSPRSTAVCGVAVIVVELASDVPEIWRTLLRDRFECWSIASTSSLSGIRVEGRYCGNADLDRNDCDNAHRLVRMAETSSRRMGRTSKTVVLRGTLNRRIRISHNVSISLSDTSTTSAYNLMGRGRRETSRRWMAMRLRLIVIWDFARRQPSTDTSLWERRERSHPHFPLETTVHPIVILVHQ